MKTYIKERAKAKGISLADIFFELGLKSYPSFIRTLENGDNLKLKQLIIISNKIGCSIDELLCEPTVVPIESTLKCPNCGHELKIEIK